MPKKTVTFKRVLSTDKFDITLDADGAEFETLPEGVTDNGDGTLTCYFHGRHPGRSFR